MPEEEKKEEEEKKGGEEGVDEPTSSSAANKEPERVTGSTFSQYVMPYKNPNPGARRSFGIRVVNIGRYRMLKDMESGKILKTKSEISALQVSKQKQNLQLLSLQFGIFFSSQYFTLDGYLLFFQIVEYMGMGFTAVIFYYFYLWLKAQVYYHRGVSQK